jgi:hypothetical protein
VARIRQRVSAGVAQHVGMHHEGESGALADTLDQAIDGVRGERAVPLRGEHMGGLGVLPL